MTNAPQTGYAQVNGLSMYYEIHGAGEPLVLLHGGFGLTEMFSAILPQLAASRQVIVVDQQGHGRTADIDRPLSPESMGDDMAALIKYMGFDSADLMGYSMGGNAALRAAMQHPELIRKLIVISVPFRRDGWYAEIRASMDQMSAATAEFLKETPMYQSYTAVAPEPDNFPVLCEKMGAMLRRDYDWSDEVAALTMPTLLISGDADSMPPTHMAQFYELLGGGQRDGGWDGSGMPKSQLAILPGTTHYNSFASPLLVPVVMSFLDAPLQENE
ncbi:MAG: alpha/beta hydrolase [Chloroflexi bacterium AL-W]|nr:alpha/beta hydrolase [Chloroflexi bacterium AL-N1]NOK66090.1 alpha/beta hydrolase [Chloroflexi bacterium AL-N10]NOK72971.1 alpha/beta hydrolase [Chloroflexi bacterium AL-N5]NOK79868.1 alpha/beta hydrolase [Chloroflexi bacterium AL-W]NOK88276.1 alpha/beta hydrolase [Chloroflexi bacterium AL-N15]